VNAHYIKACEPQRLGELLKGQLDKLGVGVADGPDVTAVAQLMKDRGNTVKEIAVLAAMFYVQPQPDAGLFTEHVTEAVKPALQTFAEKLKTVAWDKANISAAIKETLAAHSLKMPQLAMPVRLLTVGKLQTPSVDAVLELLGREVVLTRLASNA
jgi:glutamyl-tRNA synthetase